MTKTQREKASRLWAQGWSMKAIAYELGVTFSTMKHETYYHRDVYPRRYKKVTR